MEVIESWNAERPAVRCIAWLDGQRGSWSGIRSRTLISARAARKQRELYNKEHQEPDDPERKTKKAGGVLPTGEQKGSVRDSRSSPTADGGAGRGVSRLDTA